MSRYTYESPETSEEPKRSPLLTFDEEPEVEEGDDPARIVPWKRIFMWILAIVVGLFIVLVLLDKVIMPWYVKLDAEAKVPDVVGMPFPEAEELLKKEGFEVKRAEPRYSEKFPAGVILMQLPYGGAITKEGRRIYLTESRGVEMIPVPAMIGRPLREARISLMRQGFEVGEITYDNNDTIMRDLIYYQSVPANVGARPGTKIDLMISKGPTTRSLMMPNLVGLSLDEARFRLENAGLTLGVVRKKRSTFDRNVVMEQSISPYSQISERSGVNVTISDPDAPLDDGGGASGEEEDGGNQGDE